MRELERQTALAPLAAPQTPAAASVAAPAVGAALIGWIAGDVGITDVVVHPYVEGYGDWVHYAAKIAGAAFVVILGKALATRAEKKRKPAIDLEGN